jgi:DNA-binding response OmpR family regulator
MIQEATILQIDDDEDILAIGRRMFTEAGYQFSSAKTVDAGLKKAMQKRPSIILLDYFLGDRTGIDFINIVATDDKYLPIRMTPIIMFSGRSELIDELATYYSSGLRAVLKKPFGYREIVNVTENIIRSEALARKAAPSTADAVTQGDDAEKDWLEELKMSLETIAALSSDIYHDSESMLSEHKIMDIYAIYNSSRRILAMINEKLGNPS